MPLAIPIFIPHEGCPHCCVCVATYAGSVALQTSRLQQTMCRQQYNEGPQYILDDEEGPAHARVFTVSVHFHDQILGSGRASNKKEDEQQAARAALEFLQNEQDTD